MNIRYFSMTAGVVYLVIGLMGLLGIGVTHSMAGHQALTVDAQFGYLLGLFPVNVLHNLVHLAIGVWGVVAYSGVRSSVMFSKGLAVIYAVFAVMGLIPVLNTTFGLVPLYGHDIWLHAVTAGVAGYFGWVARPVQRAAAV